MDLFAVYDKTGAASVYDDVLVVVKQFTVAHMLAGAISAEEHDRHYDVSARLLCVLRVILRNERVIADGNESAMVTYIELQNAIVDCGSALAVASLLNSKDNNVGREALAFLFAFLKGGNREAQNHSQITF